LHCLPADGGLYLPASIADLRQFFSHLDQSTSFSELLSSLVPTLLEGELNPGAAERVAQSVSTFEPELLQLDKRLSVLRLYDGPCGVFKDFGVTFLAAIMQELLQPGEQTLIASATGGESGAGIARAFAGRSGMRSLLLYPDEPVYGLNPQTFCNAGGNILPVKIKGTLDTCQQLLKGLFLDTSFSTKFNLTSANTLNFGRLLPQSFFFLYAFVKLKKELSGDLVFSIPCGNFGNLLAALYAWKFAVPANGFIAAMNSNAALIDFFRGRGFVPRTTIPTITNALDVGNPVNYERLASFYAESPSVMKNMVFPEVVDDNATIEAMERVWKRYSLVLDPHSALAFEAAERFLKRDSEDGHVVVLATGHPARKHKLIKSVLGIDVTVPPALQEMDEETLGLPVLAPDLAELKRFVASSY
jgi:threonine synthase